MVEMAGVAKLPTVVQAASIFLVSFAWLTVRLSKVQLLPASPEPPDVKYPDNSLLIIDFNLDCEWVDKTHSFLFVPRLTLPKRIHLKFLIKSVSGTRDELT
jgi:hypothetical protein